MKGKKCLPRFMTPVPISVHAHEGVCVHGSTLPRAPNTTLSAPITKDD